MFKNIGKRVLLFLAINFLIVLTVSFFLNFFNVTPYITPYGIDVKQLLIFCLIWGMAGSLISLALSRKMAKWMMGVEVIDPVNCSGDEKSLLNLVYKIAKNAGLPEMPEVGIYNSPEVNAFATGPTKSRSLVAVSSGLLNRFGQNEIEGVLSHEIAHIANGDMVTMTLLQGVVNAFVMFFARIFAYVVEKALRRDEKESSPFFYMVLVMVFEVLFLILGSIVIATYSRFREYRADFGGARLAGREKMISALKALQKTVEIKDESADKEALQAFKISNTHKMMHLFSSHPPLEKRIERLEKGYY